jgi:hypothetical protein
MRLKMSKLAAAWLAAVLLMAVMPARAADMTAVSLAGAVTRPTQISAADLATRPATTVSVSFQTDRGPESARYTGALLWTLIADAGPVNVPGKNTQLRHTILVTGRDGYAVALAIGEIDPHYEGKSVLLAYAKDGRPLGPDDGIRLVVPGDQHGGRAVRDVVSVELR